MPYYNRDPKRDHNFDNHPWEFHGILFGTSLWQFWRESQALVAEPRDLGFRGLGFRGLGFKV